MGDLLMGLLMDHGYNLEKLMETNLNDAIIVLDDNFEIKAINNNEIIRKLGYNDKDLIEREFLELVHPKDRKLIKKRLKKINKSGHIREEFRFQGKQNQIIYCDLTASILKNETSENIMVIFRDISKYKLIENDRNDLEKRIKEIAQIFPEIRFWKLLYPQKCVTAVEKTREMLESVIDNIPQYIYWKDSELIYIGCNENFAKLNGYNEPNAIIGKVDEDLGWAQTRTKRIQEAEKEVIKSGIPEYHIIEQWPLPGQKNTFFEINRIPLKGLNEEVIGILVTYEDISLRIKAEEELKESRKKYADMIQNLDLGFLKIDFQGNILNFNPALVRILGLDKDEDLSKYNAKDFWYSREKLDEYVEKITEQKSLRNYIFRAKKMDGTIAYLQTDTHLIENKETGEFEVEGTVSDITEKYILEQKLKDSEERYRLISENANDFIDIINSDYRFEYINEQTHRRSLGYKKEDLLGISVFNFIHPDDHEIAKSELVKGFREGEGIAEIRIKNKNDLWIWIEVKGKVFQDISGESKGILVSRDISERKKAEKRIKESEEKLRTLNKELERKVLDRTKELRESERKFRHIFESIPDIFLLVDEEAKILDYKGKKEDLYLPPKEFLDKSITETLPTNIAKKSLKCIKDAIETKEPQIMEYNLPVHHDNQFFEARHLYLGENQVAIFVRDISTRKMAEMKLRESEKKLREQYEELKKLDQLKNDFITIAAHALKTPLISIEGYAELILTRENDLNDEIQEELKTILRNGQRLRTYITKLMDVLKIDAQKMEIFKDNENIYDLLKESLEELTFQIEKKKLDVEIKINESLILNVDGFRISEVFSNLISNAVKFTRDNGKIVISSEEKEDYFLFKITDTGRGLTEEEIGRLFEKFVMIDQNTETLSTFELGSGLGLYITKGIICAHGGEIWAESGGRNKGTTFSFTIPK